MKPVICLTLLSLAGCAAEASPANRIASFQLAQEARQAYQLNDFSTAILRASEAIQLDGQNDEAYWVRGGSFMRSAPDVVQYELALQDYQKATSINPRWRVWTKPIIESLQIAINGGDSPILSP
jgi:tetratricopeptide (TPR) repeat protein